MLLFICIMAGREILPLDLGDFNLEGFWNHQRERPLLLFLYALS